MCFDNFNQLSLRKKRHISIEMRVTFSVKSDNLRTLFQMHKGMTSDLVKKGTVKRERRTLIMVKIKIKETQEPMLTFQQFNS